MQTHAGLKRTVPIDSPQFLESITMLNQRRRLALVAWRSILERPTSRADLERKYHELLSAADGMEKEGLINGEEWRKLARKAAACFDETKY
uniref:hypothetical protein n=1 Tax=Pseudomonas sp. TaxID=306 RepID=UPI0020D24C2B|nr:hypothetical protein [Pseudomonas sp.]